jgi:hypothetical protein
MGRGRGERTRIENSESATKPEFWRGVERVLGKLNLYEQIKRASATFLGAKRKRNGVLARLRMPPAKVLNVFSTKGCLPKGQPSGETAFKSLAAPRSGQPFRFLSVRHSPKVTNSTAFPDCGDKSPIQLHAKCDQKFH